MKKILPTDSNIKFLIADDIREEVGGKFSILGYYPSNILQLSVPSTPPLPTTATVGALVIPSLTILWSFTDGAGEYSAKISIKDPAGQDLINAAPQNIIKNDTGEMNMIMKISPFIVNAKGSFECTAELDKVKYTRHFIIQ